jgi:hypothetical protein
LKQGLHGTHQGGRLWFHRYKKELVGVLGFKQCHYDPSIFMRRVDGKMLYVAVYVDDSLITRSGMRCIRELRKHMIGTFGGTTSAINYFLNLHMKYDKAGGRLEVRHTY